MFLPMQPKPTGVTDRLSYHPNCPRPLRLYTCLPLIGVDLAGILEGRMASAEGGLVPRGAEYGEGCPFRSRLRGLGERRQLPSGVRGRAPAENGFWRILKATDALFVPI